MTVTVHWDNEEHTIIRWRYLPGWNWTYINNARDTEKQMIDTVTHIVDAIGDMRQNSRIPPSAFTAVKTVMTSRHARLGITVLISNSLLVNVTYDMIQRVYPSILAKANIVLAQSEEETYRLIDEQRQRRVPKS